MSMSRSRLHRLLCLPRILQRWRIRTILSSHSFSGSESHAETVSLSSRRRLFQKRRSLSLVPTIKTLGERKEHEVYVRKNKQARTRFVIKTACLRPQDRMTERIHGYVCLILLFLLQ
ncbi:hypothetical protein KP509_12G086500 [Ceratopteris richardii]|uniref:Uncharacterized protein n=1 Tax=Ceratopteris richardii TaxID=49495 RepID=A0A8T2TL20_CERRI|nr:hypothetical protein KP509_12G086500 [Ceratopteris richardii]